MATAGPGLESRVDLSRSVYLLVGTIEIITRLISRKQIILRNYRTISTIRSISNNPEQHRKWALHFDPYMYGLALKQCTETRDVKTGTAIHCHTIKRGGRLHLYADNILLNFYVKCFSVVESRKLFDEMPERNVVSFVTLIQGYWSSEMYNEAVDLVSMLFREGHEVNVFVLTSVLKLLVAMGQSELGGVVHACVCKLGHEGDPFVGAGLIDVYSVCGEVRYARKVFKSVGDNKDMVFWTGMVSCYVQNELFDEALESFKEMRVLGFKPNNFTFTSLLKACVGLREFRWGESVYAFALKAGYVGHFFVALGLLELYTEFGDLSDALSIFDEVCKEDVVAWSFMIARYAQSGLNEKALEMFCWMRREAFVLPNEFTFSSLLQACANLENFNFGNQIHCHIVKVGLDTNEFVPNALMDVYAKCSKMDNVMQLFEEFDGRNDVSWNTMIVGYVQAAEPENALGLFKNMLQCRVQATQVTYSIGLRACSSLAALELGVQIHALTVKTMFDTDSVVGNALIDMYAKCGNIKDAKVVFDTLSGRDQISWNTMISGYATHGLSRDALETYDTMLKTDCKPNNLTFVSVLSACSNAGLLDQGQYIFKTMVQHHGIEPSVEHYTCMVGLFGRAGLLKKAYKLIQEMPIQPSVMIWRSLLGACVIHKDVELGRVCTQRVLEIEPQDESAHVLLANMYASSRSWKDAAAIRKSMKKKGVNKDPGLSWIENHGTLHYFFVGDDSHPDTKLINAMLEWLNMKTRNAGYIPDSNVVLLHVEDDEKPRRLWVHSERLALACALIKGPKGSHIRIIKNLRICTDCHAVMKLISKIIGRVIIIRDINRYHHFQNGTCSCGDYW